MSSIQRLLQLLPAALILSAAAFPFSSARAQRLSRADAYYLEFSLNAVRQPIFCHPLDSAIGIPRCYAVDYDTLGRPAQVTRLFFGNLDSRGDWTIMKFRYDSLPKKGLLVRRTWHNPSGFAVQLGIAWGEETFYDSTGGLVMATAIDKEALRVEQVNAVTRSIFRAMPDGSYVQEWRYSNNKQYNGSEPDRWGTQFAPLDRNAWFRVFRTDERGNLVEETPWSLAKRPIPFPGGEITRRYERNSCGQPLSVRFFDSKGNPMEDSSGVASLTYTYDANERITGWRSFDLNGKPKGRREANNAASMSRVYREFDGVLLKETYYDAEGKEMGAPAAKDEKG